MAIRNIVQVGDEVLRKKSAPVTAFDPMFTGATIMVSDPMNVLSPMVVGFLWTPS